MKKLLVLAALAIVYPLNANADESAGKSTKEAWLQSYQSNSVGWTFDNNDVGFMDFSVSLKYPLLSVASAVSAKKNVTDGESFRDFRTRYLRSIPYFSFTGRFGQYIGTRKSSPVIGKRFNPKIFLRLFTSDPDESYFDIGYGHESNGQRINSQSAYQDLRDDFIREGEDPEFANDYISRGWDYWEVTWFNKFSLDGKVREQEVSPPGDVRSDATISTFVSLKYFMEDGYLQGEAEEYNSWENAGDSPARKEFDGVSVKFAYQTKKYIFEVENLTLSLFGGLSLIYTTGYKDSFSNNTIRVETIIRVGTFPLLVWWSEGYNSDLVGYYRRVRSGGVGLDLKTF